jgi:outer membrane protein TolC
VANAGLMVSQELPAAGKRKLRGDLAAREADAEFQQYHAVRLNVASRVKIAWHQLHHAYEAVSVMEKNRDLLRQLIRVSEVRYAAGRARQQDVFKLQSQLAVMETEIVRMSQDRFRSEAELNSLLNRPPGSPLAEPPETALGEFPWNAEDLLAEASKQAPLLRREQKMIERGQLAVNLARKDYYPDYVVSAGYFNMGGMADMYQFRVDIRVPAYFWRKQRAEVHQEVAVLSQAKKSYEAANRSLEFRVKNEFVQAETAYKLARLYQDSVMPPAKLALESALAGYETGSGEFSMLLMNYMAVVDFELKFHEEMVKFRTAVARLEELVGHALEGGR